MNNILEKANNMNSTVKNGILLLAFCVTGIVGYLLIGEDLTHVIRWWGVLGVLGIGMFPVCTLLFGSFRDSGYLFGKILGLVCCGYLMWLFSAIKLLQFSTLNCIIISVIFFLIIYLITGISYKKNGKFGVHAVQKGKDSLPYMLMAELFFFVLLILFIYLLGNKVIGTETEKSMDLAFMNTIGKTTYFPPMDSWASGTTLNYYYFGQYLFTFLCKISITDISIGYSLSMATIAVFCFILVYFLVYEVMRHKLQESGQTSRNFICNIAGILSGIGVTFCGNMHYIVFGKLVPMIWEILQLPGEQPSYWFASSTRYIGYIPDVEGDKTISEFPAYSILIGDLHAHVIDIMIVLTILALAFAFSLGRKKTENETGNNETCNDIIWNNKTFLMEAFHPTLLMIALLIGICSMTNYWDYPIYYVICGSVVLFSNLKKYGQLKRTVGMTLLQGAIMLCIIHLVALPFNLSFEKMMMGIGVCKTHSKLYQLVILWGFPVVMAVIFWFVCLKDCIQKKEIGHSDRYMVLISLCGVGLLLLPEIIYVKDIYEAGFPRANTMFKLTYEAFILLGIVLGYVITSFLFLEDRKRHRKAGIAGLICLCLTFGYFYTASRMWLGEYWKVSNYQGIDAETYFAQILPADYKAIQWLRENVEGQPVVLEADGDSYTDYERVSVLTGFPTILGWHTHEWLWKNSYDFMDERQNDITTIYTSRSEDEVRNLLEKYEVNYVYVGEKEYEKYTEADFSFLQSIGQTVYSEFSDISGNRIMIIKVADEEYETK